MSEQKNIGYKDFVPFNSIFGILRKPVLVLWWYFAPPLEWFSTINNDNIIIKRINDNWLAVFKSSKANQEL